MNVPPSGNREEEELVYASSPEIPGKVWIKTRTFFMLDFYKSVTSALYCHVDFPLRIGDMEKWFADNRPEFLRRVGIVTET